MPGSCVASWAITGVASTADTAAAAPNSASFFIIILRLQLAEATGKPGQRSGFPINPPRAGWRRPRAADAIGQSSAPLPPVLRRTQVVPRRRQRETDIAGGSQRIR